MEFKKYNSIENSYRKKFLDKIVEEGHSKEEYVVQEKIHGANFSFWMDQAKTECAKRSGFVKEGEKFYNFQDVKKDYYQKMRDLFQSFYSEGASVVTVYGELFGGDYPHKDVPKTQQSCVQKHVYYSPKQDFIAFDLKVDGIYMSLDFANEVFEKFGIPYCKTLFRGSLEDCLAYQNEYITTLPREAGLPEIEGNICEGNVIRPINPIFLWSGERLIIKNKNKTFSEKHGYDVKNKERKPVKQLEPHIVEAIETASQYINENRLRNVLSKVGEVGQKDFGKIMGLFTQDIIEDYMKDESKSFNGLEKKDRQLITKNIGQRAAYLLRQNFINIVDGEF
jgi:Rnl2 family RNA ligase